VFVEVPGFGQQGGEVVKGAALPETQARRREEVLKLIEGQP
jgi:hypothetical protein